MQILRRNLCDTYYTSWDPADSHNIGILSIAEILAEYEKVNCTDVVITGESLPCREKNFISLLRRSKDQTAMPS